nr:hypothetical protein CFP56_65756 [Quercus suber]
MSYIKLWVARTRTRTLKLLLCNSLASTVFSAQVFPGSSKSVRGESEGNKFTVQEESRAGDYLLAAKFHTRRTLNMEAIAKTFKLLWRTRKGFEIRDMGDHMVLFRFPEATNIERVLQGEP